MKLSGPRSFRLSLSTLVLLAVIFLMSPFFAASALGSAVIFICVITTLLLGVSGLIFGIFELKSQAVKEVYSVIGVSLNAVLIVILFLILWPGLMSLGSPQASGVDTQVVENEVP